MQPSLPVLVVDDSATMRAIIVKQLNALGFGDIDVAEDGSTALVRLKDRE